MARKSKTTMRDEAAAPKPKPPEIQHSTFYTAEQVAELTGQSLTDIGMATKLGTLRSHTEHDGTVLYRGGWVNKWREK